MREDDHVTCTSQAGSEKDTSPVVPTCNCSAMSTTSQSVSEKDAPPVMPTWSSTMSITSQSGSEKPKPKQILKKNTRKQPQKGNNCKRIFF